MAIKYLSGITVDSTVLVVDSANDRVGIGTSSPTSQLHVQSASPELLLYNTTTAGGTLNFVDQGWQSQIVGIQGNLLFKTGGTTERVRITNDGLVGIGTTSPTVKLQVDNNSHNYIQVNSSVANVQTALNVTNSASTSRATLSWEDGTRGAYADLYSSTYLTFTTQSSEKMRITAAGTVAIGNAGSGGGYGIEINNSASTPRIDLVDNSNYTAQLKSNGLVVTLQNNSNNALVLGTNGTERVRVTAGGNVGIGTTSPSQKLEVSGGILGGPVYTTSRFIVNSTASPGISDISLGSYVGGSWLNTPASTTGYLSVGGSAAFSYSSSNLIWYTDSGSGITEKMRITAAGNVGIGTTSPDTLLTVNGASGTKSFSLINSTGSTRADFTVTENSGLTIDFNEGATARALSLSSAGSSRLFITSAGNVGIGTTSPSEKLTVLGSDATTFQGAGIYNSYTYGNADKAESRFNLGKLEGSTYQPMGAIGAFPTDNTNSANGILSFYTRTSQSVTEKMRITSGGNVGIGTTSPAEKLHVSGRVRIGDYMKIASGSNYMGQIGFNRNVEDGTIYNTSYGAHQVQNYNGTLEFQVYDSSGIYVTQHNMFANGNVSLGGNVGIGTTSPSARLHVYQGASGNSLPSNAQAVFEYDANGGISISTPTGNAAGVYFSYSTSPYYAGIDRFETNLRVFSGNAERMRITSDGNVGIGTTSPGAKLDVVGTSIFSDTLSINTNKSIRTYPNSTGGYAMGITMFSADTSTASSSEIYGRPGFVGRNLSFNGTQFVAASTDSGNNWGTVTGMMATNVDVRFITRPATDEGLNFGLGSNLDSITRMVVTTGGNVGIGTTSPTGTYGKLTVNGSISLLDDQNTKLEIGRYSSGASNSYIKLGANSNSLRVTNNNDTADIFTITNDGNVGIGTTSPVSSANSIFVTTAGVNASGYVTRVDGTTSMYVYSITTESRISEQRNLPLVFETNGTEKMRITALGRVIIGRTFDSGAPFNLQVDGRILQTGTEFLFEGDNDKRITVYAARPLIFATTDTERMRITAAGNVGIGTTNPQDKLEIKQGYLRMYDPSSSVGAGYFLQWSSDNGGSNVTYAGIDAITTNAGVRTGDLRFFTSNAGGPTEKMRIKADGNVGIGTTNPLHKLQVDGNISIFGGTYLDFANGDVRFVNSSGLLSIQTYSVSTGLSTKMVVTGAGNVGIGTTSPYGRLHLTGDYNGAQNTLNLENNWPNTYRTSLINFWAYYNTSNPLAVIEGGQDESATNAGQIVFKTMSSGAAPAERMRITPSGNVGIGTTSPSDILHVYKSGANTRMIVGNNANYDQYIYFQGNNDWSIGIDASNSNAFTLSNYSTIGTNDRITVTTAGNVGIGTTSPAYTLDVSGSARVNSTSNLAMFIKTSSSFGAGISFEDSTTGGNDVVHAGAIGSDFYITTGFSERFRIDSNGFVGIAATPSSSWTLAIDSLFGADGALKTTGSVNINSGALGVNVAPSATAGRIDASNDIVAYSTSDSRLKENITPIANALDKVKSLTGVEFDWKEETKDVHGYEGHDVGVIAQEVQAVLPEAIRTNDSGYLSVRYEKMIALLIEANKELAARVEELEKKLK